MVTEMKREPFEERERALTAEPFAEPGAVGAEIVVAGCGAEAPRSSPPRERRRGESERVLSARVESVEASVRWVLEELKAMEDRQVQLDRRLSEQDGLLQGVREEQHSQNCSLQRSHRTQRTLALGARRALHSAVAVSERLEEHEASRGQAEASRGQAEESLAAQLGRQLEQRLEGALADIEQQRRQLHELSDTRAVCLRELSDTRAACERELSDARAACERQQRQLHEFSGELAALTFVRTSPAPADPRVDALESGQRKLAASVRKALQTSLAAQQQQQDEGEQARVSPELERHVAQRLRHQDDRLDKVLKLVDSLTDKVMLAGARPREASPPPNGAGGPRDRAALELKSQVEELEVRVRMIASGLPTEGWSPAGLPPALEGLAARVDRSMGELSRRLDQLAEQGDQQRLAVRELVGQLPEAERKADRLWSQCQASFAKAQEQQVQLGLLRSTVERVDDQLKQLLDRTEAMERRSAAGFGPSTTLARGACWPAATGASSTAETVEPSADQYHSGRWRAEDDFRARGQMLAEIMKRLHDNPGSHAG